MDLSKRKILIARDDIARRVQELGQQITDDYRASDRPLVVISVLKGAIPFTADLIRAIDLPLELHVLVASSYGSGTKSSGVVKIVKDLDNNVEGYDLLLVEDILDSGLTLSYLRELLRDRHPNSIKIVTLLNKPTRRTADIQPDYCCFEVPDEFVVGYGLDFDERYRNLPYVGVLKEEVYQG